jgi:DNA-directed RNA polymerase subunit N (RpoN/RPB10)
MKINCLSCGHSLDLRDAYDDYKGQVRCFICASLLAIRTQDGQVKSVELVRSPLEAVACTSLQSE